MATGQRQLRLPVVPSGWHNFAMADGSVQFINNDINYQIYKAYGGRDDAMPVKE